MERLQYNRQLAKCSWQLKKVGSRQMQLAKAIVSRKKFAVGKYHIAVEKSRLLAKKLAT